MFLIIIIHAMIDPLLFSLDFYLRTKQMASFKIEL